MYRYEMKKTTTKHSNKHSSDDERPKITNGIFGIQAIKAGVDKCVCTHLYPRHLRDTFFKKNVKQDKLWF